MGDEMRVTARTSPSAPHHREAKNPSLRNTRLCDKGQMTAAS